MTFGEYLDQLLRDRNLKVEHLAWLIGVDPTLVRRWIRGAKIPELKTNYYQLISDALQLTEEERRQLNDAQRHSCLSDWLVRSAKFPRDRADDASDWFWGKFRRITRIANGVASVRRRIRRRAPSVSLPLPGSEYQQIEFWNDGAERASCVVRYLSDDHGRGHHGRVLQIEPGSSAIYSTYGLPSGHVEAYPGSGNTLRSVASFYRVGEDGLPVLLASTSGYHDRRAASGNGPSPALKMDLPILVKNYGGYNSYVIVVNGNDVPASVKIDVLAGDSNQEHMCFLTAQIGPHSESGRSLEDVPLLPDGFCGKGRLVSEPTEDWDAQLLAAWVRIEKEGGPTYWINKETPSDELSSVLRHLSEGVAPE